MARGGSTHRIAAIGLVALWVAVVGILFLDALTLVRAHLRVANALRHIRAPRHLLRRLRRIPLLVTPPGQVDPPRPATKRLGG